MDWIAGNSLYKSSPYLILELFRHCGILFVCFVFHFNTTNINNYFNKYREHDI